MKKEQLSEMIGFADEKMLAESEQTRRFPIIMTASLGAVACAVLVFGVAALVHQGNDKDLLVGENSFAESTDAVTTDAIETVTAVTSDNLDKGEFTDLPHLTLSRPSNDSPFNIPQYTLPVPGTIPVYRNTAFDNSFETNPTQKEIDNLNARIEQAAADLGETVLSTQLVYNGVTHDSIQVQAQTEHGTLIAFIDGHTTMAFTEPYRLEKYHTDTPQADESDEFVINAENTAMFRDALLTFSDFTHIEHPQFLTYTGIDPAKVKYVTRYSVCAFEESDDEATNILNYSLNMQSTKTSNITWHAQTIRLDNRNDVEMVSRTDVSESLEKIGDYPLISQEMAEQALRQGTFPEAWKLDVEDFSKLVVKSCGLWYDPHMEYNGEEYCVPYYRFAVQPTADSDQTLLCYVPAIDGMYYDFLE